MTLSLCSKIPFSKFTQKIPKLGTFKKKKGKTFFGIWPFLSSFFRKLGKPKNLGCFLGILGPLESLNNYSVNILTTSKVLSVSCVGLYCLIGTCAHRSNVPGKPLSICD